MTMPTEESKRIVHRTSSSNSSYLDGKFDVSSAETEDAWYHPAGFTPEEAKFLSSFTEEQRKRVIRKVDWRLIPVLVMLYIMSHLDRANIGNANIEGMSTDLRISGSQYNIALSVFFIPYILLEIPANLALKSWKFKDHPSWWIGTMATSWGLVMTFTSIVRNFQGLVVCRFFLGLCEAGFFPGAFLIVTNWYVANEVGVRFALFFCASAVAGAFSGLLAFFLSKMDGIAGLDGWRWIFLIEGLASFLVGVACPWILVDTPANSKWLDEDEKRYLLLRQEAQDGCRHTVQSNQKLTWKVLKSVLLDWKIYFQGVIAVSNSMPTYGLKFTMPQIMKNMGYTSANAQLLTIPPYFVGAVSAYVASRLSDKYRWRMPFIVGGQVCVLIGFAISFAYAADIKHNIARCYFAVMLSCIGLYPIMPGASAWSTNNLAGPMRRAVGIGFLGMIVSGGGVVGSFIYIQEEAPSYPTGFGTSLAAAAAGIVACFVQEFLLWRINKKNEKFTEEQVRAMYTEQELADLGDKSPLFRYTL